MSANSTLPFPVWVALAAFVAALVPGTAGAQGTTPTDPGAWNREAAARYLDDRMEVWFANAKKLQTGDGLTRCVSCHTAVPYALARPALRRAMHENTPTPQEARLLDDVTHRVASYDAHQLYYDSDERKKTESRGTEAVINALVLATADAQRQPPTLSVPTRRAFGRLWEVQRSDGAWDWLDFGLEPFETVDGAYQGATLAAFAAGTSMKYSGSLTPDAAAGVDRLRDYLQKNYATQRLFNRTWMLLASTRLERLLDGATRKNLVAELLRAQREDGGWSLQSLGGWRWNRPEPPFSSPGALDTVLLAKSDGYATGLVVYSLQAAGLGTQPAVQRGLTWLRVNQQAVQVGDSARAAWRAYSLNFDREHGGPKGEAFRRLFMSDLATAFAVLALTTTK
jgi:squalene-hopene/tetraprenyl-beta-curcumene cyclase